MLNPIEQFKGSILHLNRDWNHWSCDILTLKWLPESLRCLPHIFILNFICCNCPSATINSVIQWIKFSHAHVFSQFLASLEFIDLRFLSVMERSIQMQN